MKIAFLDCYNLIFNLTMISIGLYGYRLFRKHTSVTMIKITIY